MIWLLVFLSVHVSAGSCSVIGLGAVMSFLLGEQLLYLLDFFIIIILKNQTFFQQLSQFKGPLCKMLGKPFWQLLQPGFLKYWCSLQILFQFFWSSLLNTKGRVFYTSNDILVLDIVCSLPSFTCLKTHYGPKVCPPPGKNLPLRIFFSTWFADNLLNIIGFHVKIFVTYLKTFFYYTRPQSVKVFSSSLAPNHTSRPLVAGRTTNLSLRGSLLAGLAAPERPSSHRPITAQKLFSSHSRSQIRPFPSHFIWGFVGCSPQKYIVYWRCEQITGAGPPGEDCKEQQRADVRHDPPTSDGCNFKRWKIKHN